jgi:hypothetical protein
MYTYTHTRIYTQEGFHDLRKATEHRYLEYRRDHFAHKKAARRAADARRAQRARRCVFDCF